MVGYVTSLLFATLLIAGTSSSTIITPNNSWTALTTSKPIQFAAAQDQLEQGSQPYSTQKESVEQVMRLWASTFDSEDGGGGGGDSEDCKNARLAYEAAKVKAKASLGELNRLLEDSKAAENRVKEMEKAEPGTYTFDEIAVAADLWRDAAQAAKDAGTAYSADAQEVSNTENTYKSECGVP
jgi:hypothetical protein